MINRLIVQQCNNRSHKGFVLIELIIVTAVIGIVSAIGIGTFVSYSQTQKLQTAINDLRTTLNVAKSNSFSQVKDSALCTQSLEGYKVVISCSTYDLYVVCGGVDYEIMNTKSLPENVMLSKSSPMSVFFPILKSQVSGSGTIPLTGFGQTKCILIDSVGVISQVSSCPSPVPCSTPVPTPGS